MLIANIWSVHIFVYSLHTSLEKEVSSLTLLHSERPKLYGVVTLLSARGLTIMLHESCQDCYTARNVFETYFLMHVNHGPWLQSKRKERRPWSEMLPQTIEHYVQRSCYHEEVRRKIQAAIGEHDEHLTLVKKRKQRWFGYLSMSSGLAKKIRQEQWK